MHTNKSLIKKCRMCFGFTLIEALTFLFLFSVIALTFYAVFSSGTMHIIESKNRLGAIAVANTKMEIIRNLDYDAIGTKHPNGNGGFDYGIPAGDILEDETVSVNTREFFVHTFVQYVDDAFDGKSSGTTPIDTIPNDYKRVKIEVSWGAGTAGQTVAITSVFAPKGVEVSAGGGVLSLNVLDSSGLAVPSVSTHIVNAGVSPSVNISTTTDATGNLTLPGASASVQGYRIELSKSGYFPATTYAPYPTSDFYPDDVHASVVEGSFNQKTIIFDRASDMNIVTEDAFGTVVPDIDFQLTGGRRIGSADAGASASVFFFDQALSTDAGGEKSLSGQSPGVYTLQLATPTQYRVLRITVNDATSGAAVGEFSVAPNITAQTKVVLADNNVPGLLLTARDQSGSALPGATVRLQNQSLSYDATVTADAYGQGYFPTSLPALVSGDYEYAVSASGYHDKTGTVTVGSNLKTLTAVLDSL